MKAKAFLYNFTSFLVIFLVVRFLVLQITGTYSLWAVFGAAIVASLLSPKFAVTRENDKDVIKMKWMFLKGFRTFR